MPYPVALCDGRGTALQVNGAFERLFADNLMRAVRREESLFEDPALAQTGLRQQLRRALSGETVVSLEVAVARADGGPDLVQQVTMIPAGAHGDHPRAVVTIWHDATEHHEAARALRMSEQRYRMLVERAPLGIVVADDAGVVVEANPRACELLEQSRDVLVGSEWRLLLSQQTPALSGAVIDEGQIEDIDLTYKDRLLRLTTAVIAEQGRQRVTMIEDVTETRQLEEQLRQVQKMEAVGQIAGGVAHDINNLLTAISGLASALEIDFPCGDPRREDLAAILAACGRGRELTQNLLGFARRGKYRVTTVQLNQLVTETVQLLDRTLAKKVSVETRLAPVLPPIQGDPSQLSHVLMNLALNAVDAMGGEGTLLFSTAITSAVREQIRGLRPGGHVKLQVVDSGRGMDPETAQHAFEPFFTTKPQGKGTGLGLSMVYGTIKHHGGEVVLETAEGTGTTVTILLPALTTAEVQLLPPPSAAAVPSGAGRLVLLVDDEELVRRAGKRMLEKLGYEVLLADDGEQALAQYERQGGEIALVILDLAMPVKDGTETFRELRQIDPQAKVLLSSGYYEERLADQLLAQGALGFVQKPYTLDVLGRHLSVLDS